MVNQIEQFKDWFNSQSEKAQSLISLIGVFGILIMAILAFN